jgi:hypothetical protein
MRTTRQKFNLILTLAVMLTMVQTALAVKVTKTVTWSLSGTSSVNTTQQDNWTLVSGGKVLHYSNNDKENNDIY